ncbi:MAG: molecular chaperone TorD [Halomonas sp.]|uniref:molecular chaperone TorD n=1 Tax=Halomonas sp. TaxID=1486246 RepID=UPI003F91048D
MSDDTFQQRALICRWLSTLLANELDDSTLQAYFDGQAKPILETLGEYESMAALITRFNNALNAVRLLEHPQLELAADFASLFLVDGHASAPPYASLYQSQGEGQTAMFYRPVVERMEVRLKAAGYQVDDQFKEPADHLAIMLDYLATGWERIANTQESFAQNEMLQGLEQFVRSELAWLPRFERRAEGIETVCDLYPCIVAMVTQYRSVLLDDMRHDRQANDNGQTMR